MAYLFDDGTSFIECTGCKLTKRWWKFKIEKNTHFPLCFDCQSKDLTIKIKTIIKMANENNMQYLRDKLFECIEGLRYKTISISEAKAIGDMAQIIINSVKVEVEYIKAVGGKTTGSFMTEIPKIESKNEQTEEALNQYLQTKNK